MQFYSSNSQNLFDDIILLPQKGAVAGPTGRPPNSYAILFDDHSVLFDAAYSWNLSGIRVLVDEGKPPRALVLSHRNVAGAGDLFDTLQLEFGLPIFLHPDDAKHEEASKRNIDYENPVNSDLLQRDKLETIHIPGHTDGSIMLYYSRHGGVLFAGDSAVAPGPKQDLERSRLLRPKMPDEKSDRNFKERWQKLAKERQFNSVLPLHGTAYVEHEDISKIVTSIWMQEPMNPAKSTQN